MYTKILTIIIPRRGYGQGKRFPQVIFFPFCLAVCSAISIYDSCQKGQGKRKHLIFIFLKGSFSHTLPDLPLKQLSVIASNIIPILWMRKLYIALWQTEISWFPYSTQAASSGWKTAARAILGGPSWAGPILGRVAPLHPTSSHYRSGLRP